MLNLFHKYLRRCRLWGGSFFFPPHIPDGCVIAPSAQVHPTASLENLHGGSDAIIIGADTHIRGQLLTFWHGGKITLGDYCYLGEGARIWAALSVAIGHRTLISHNVNIFDNNTHPIDDPVARHMQVKQIFSGERPSGYGLHERPVRIGDDVLIACGAIILPGVTIGAGAVVGAGSVVTKDVAAYTLVAGNPAGFVRHLEPHGIR